MNRTNVKRILAHLKKAQDILDNMSDKSKEKIFKLHYEGYTLQYCLRWGIAAAEQVLDEYPGRVKK